MRRCTAKRNKEGKQKKKEIETSETVSYKKKEGTYHY